MFEKKFGDRRGIEDVIVSKRRFQYEEEVKVSVLRNYVWKSVESGTKEEDGFIFLVYRFNALIGLFSLYWCKKQNRLRIWGFRLIVNLQVLCHLLCCLGKLRGKWNAKKINHTLIIPGKSTQLRRLVRLPPSGGERRRRRYGERCLWKSHRQHPTHPGEETLEAIHLPVDQLRSVWGARGQGGSIIRHLVNLQQSKGHRSESCSQATDITRL